MDCCWLLAIGAALLCVLQPSPAAAQYAQGRCASGSLYFDVLEIRGVREHRSWYYETEASSIMDCVELCRQKSDFCFSIGFIPSDGRRSDSKNVCLFSYANGRGCTNRPLVNRISGGNRHAVVECIRCPSLGELVTPRTPSRGSVASRNDIPKLTPRPRISRPVLSRPRPSASSRSPAPTRRPRISSPSRSSSPSSSSRRGNRPSPASPSSRTRTHTTRGPRTRLRIPSGPRITKAPTTTQPIIIHTTVEPRSFTRPAVRRTRPPVRPFSPKPKASAADAECWLCNEVQQRCDRAAGIVCRPPGGSLIIAHATKQSCVDACGGDVGSGEGPIIDQPIEIIETADNKTENQTDAEACFACDSSSGVCISHSSEACATLDRPQYATITECVVAGCSRTAEIIDESSEIQEKPERIVEQKDLIDCFQCFDVFGASGRVVPPRFALGEFASLPPQTANCWSMESPQVTKKCPGTCVTRRISSKQLTPGSTLPEASAQSLSIVSNLLANFGLGDMQIVIRNCSDPSDDAFESSDQFEVQTSRCTFGRCNDEPTDVSPDISTPTIELAVGPNGPDMGNSSIPYSEMEPQGEGEYICHSCFDVFGRQGRILVPKEIEANLGRVLPAQMTSCWNNPQIARRCETPCATTTALNLDPEQDIAQSGEPAQSMIFSLIGLDALSIVLRNCSGVNDSALIQKLDDTPHICAGAADLGVESNVSVCICKTDRCNNVSAEVDIPASQAPLNALIEEAPQEVEVVIDAGRKRWQCLDGVSCSPCGVGECVLDISAWDTEDECNRNCPENPSCWFCSPEGGKCGGALAFPCSTAVSDPIRGPFESEMKCMDICMGGLLSGEEGDKVALVPDAPPRPTCPAGKILFSVKDEEMLFERNLKVTSPEECIFLCYTDPKCHKAAITKQRGFSQFQCSFGSASLEDTCPAGLDGLVTSFILRGSAVISCFACERGEREETKSIEEIPEISPEFEDEKKPEEPELNESGHEINEIEAQAIIDSEPSVVDNKPELELAEPNWEPSNETLSESSNSTLNASQWEDLSGAVVETLNDTVSVTVADVDTNILEEANGKTSVDKALTAPAFKLAPSAVCDGSISFVAEPETESKIKFETRMELASVAECAFLCFADPDCLEAAAMPVDGNSTQIRCFLGSANDKPSLECGESKHYTEHAGDQPIRIGCFKCAAASLAPVALVESAAIVEDNESPSACNGSISFVVKTEIKSKIKFLTTMDVLSVAECAFLCAAGEDCQEALAMPIDGDSASIRCFLGSTNDKSVIDCSVDAPRHTEYIGVEPVRIGCFECAAGAEVPAVDGGVATKKRLKEIRPTGAKQIQGTTDVPENEDLPPLCNSLVSFAVAGAYPTSRLSRIKDGVTVPECAFLCYADPDCWEAGVVLLDTEAQVTRCFLGAGQPGRNCSSSGITLNSDPESGILTRNCSSSDLVTEFVATSNPTKLRCFKCLDRLESERSLVKSTFDSTNHDQSITESIDFYESEPLTLIYNEKIDENFLEIINLAQNKSSIIWTTNDSFELNNSDESSSLIESRMTNNSYVDESSNGSWNIEQSIKLLTANDSNTRSTLSDAWDIYSRLTNLNESSNLNLGETVDDWSNKNDSLNLNSSESNTDTVESSLSASLNSSFLQSDLQIENGINDSSNRTSFDPTVESTTTLVDESPVQTVTSLSDDVTSPQKSHKSFKQSAHQILSIVKVADALTSKGDSEDVKKDADDAKVASPVETSTFETFPLDAANLDGWLGDGLESATATTDSGTAATDTTDFFITEDSDQTDSPTTAAVMIAHMVDAATPKNSNVPELSNPTNHVQDILIKDVRWYCNQLECVACKRDECPEDVAYYVERDACATICPLEPDCWYCNIATGNCTGASGAGCQPPSTAAIHPFKDRNVCHATCLSSEGVVRPTTGPRPPSQESSEALGEIVHKSETEFANMQMESILSEKLPGRREQLKMRSHRREPADVTKPKNGRLEKMNRKKMETPVDPVLPATTVSRSNQLKVLELAHKLDHAKTETIKKTHKKKSSKKSKGKNKNKDNKDGTKSKRGEDEEQNTEASISNNWGSWRCAEGQCVPCGGDVVCEVPDYQTFRNEGDCMLSCDPSYRLVNDYLWVCDQYHRPGCSTCLTFIGYTHTVSCVHLANESELDDPSRLITAVPRICSLVPPCPDRNAVLFFGRKLCEDQCSENR